MRVESDVDECFCKRADVYADVYFPVQTLGLALPRMLWMGCRPCKAAKNNTEGAEGRGPASWRSGSLPLGGGLPRSSHGLQHVTLLPLGICH